MSGDDERVALAMTRRRFLFGGAALAAAIELDAHPAQRGAGHVRGAVGHQPAGLPVRQHAWNDTLARDADGNPIAPRHDRLLFFDVAGRPSLRHVAHLEAVLRTLERRFRWGPDGLLFLVAYSPRYFTRTLGRASPIPAATALSDFELPAIDPYDVVLHLASDSERRLAEVEAALVHGVHLPGSDGPLGLSPVLTWRATRTGFVGAGLPAAHQDVGGIPANHPVPRAAPLYMGFKSSLARNQASEDAITIGTGPFIHGTTMAISYMRLSLDSWYGKLDAKQRVARMYAPQVTVREADAARTDAASDPRGIEQAIRRYGVIGHAQASATARRHGRPIILRRDFNTADGGQAGVHFVALQRAIADFVATRTAMNQSAAKRRNRAVGDVVNNGINDFIFVLNRGNYIVPGRADRAFPMLSA